MGTVDFFIKVGKGVIAMQSEDQHRTLFILTNPAMNMELKENAKEAEDEENVRIKFMSGAANPEEHSAFWGRASAYQKIRLIGTGKGWKNNYAHLYPERRHGAVAIKCGRMKDTILRAHRVVFEERSEFCNYLLEVILVKLVFYGNSFKKHIWGRLELYFLCLMLRYSALKRAVTGRYWCTRRCQR